MFVIMIKMVISIYNLYM